MPSNITDTSTFTDPVQTVSDGDAASAANFALAPQGLSNRTRYLKNRIDASDINYAAAKTNVVRVIDIFKAQLQESGSQTWQTNSADASGIESRGGSVYMRIALDEYLVDGATLGSVDVDVDPGTGEATVGNRITCGVFRRTRGTSPAADLLGSSATADSTGNAQTIAITTNTNNVIDKTTYSYHLKIAASASGGSSPYDAVLGARLTMSSVPGLRP